MIAEVKKVSISKYELPAPIKIVFGSALPLPVVGHPLKYEWVKILNLNVTHD